MNNHTQTCAIAVEPPAARLLCTLLIACGIAIAAAAPLAARAETLLPFNYIFNTTGTLYEASSAAKSTSPYFWLKSGAKLTIENGRGTSIQSALSQSDPWYTIYAARASVSSDKGAHPQNVFQLFSRDTFKNISAQVYFNRTADNLANAKNRYPWSGESLFARYVDENNYYYAGIRTDGYVVIKKRVNGAYTTLATKKILPGTYSASGNPDLIPMNSWIGLKLTVTDDANGAPQLTLATDLNWNGNWDTALKVSDDHGSTIKSAGMVGIGSDYADVQFDNFALTNDLVSLSAGMTGSVTDPQSEKASSYDSVVLADAPSLYLAMNAAASGSEKDLSGGTLSGQYKGGTPGSASLPNGDSAADFDGKSQYLTVPSASSLSIPKTGVLTWEAWIRPDTLDFQNASGDGYVDFMGKCAYYSPTCEWEARMYSAQTAQDRPSRVSAYVFNPSAGLGSAADWQPQSGSIAAGEWIHVVAEYDTTETPSQCSSKYPGTINIWVNGVKQSFADHAPTGCMSQYSITPQSGNSPLLIGTMALDTWFKGAIGKVAVYNRLLTQSQINAHFSAMTGKTPSGSCGATCTIPPLSSL